MHHDVTIVRFPSSRGYRVVFNLRAFRPLAHLGLAESSLGMAESWAGSLLGILLVCHGFACVSQDLVWSSNDLIGIRLSFTVLLVKVVNIKVMLVVNVNVPVRVNNIT